MSNVDEELIKEETTVKSEPLHKIEEKSETPVDPFTDVIKRAVKEAISETDLVPDINKTQIIGQPWVKVEFPEVQDIKGEVTLEGEVDAKISNFPDIQKVSGLVKAEVDFPDIQRIEGDVTAKVDFPDIQKVDVTFPDTQKVKGEISIPDFPIGEGVEPSRQKANPTRYVPVRLTNGKFFYDVMSQSVNSSNQGTAVLRDILSELRDGTLNTTASVTLESADGAITDGVSAAIKASVLDYANSNPLAVRLTDTAGDYVAAGAGTQYTEDVAAAADPIGSMGMMVRSDVPTAQVSANSDNIAFRGTNKGELFVKQIDSIPVHPSGIFTISGTAIPHTMGQSMLDRLGGQFNSTKPTLAEGQTSLFQLGSRGELVVNLYNGSQSIDYTADNADDAAASAVASKLKVVARNTYFDGSTWDRMRGDSTDGLLVNLGANNDITGTVTANLSATDNAVLDNIDADLTTIIGHVDGLEGLLTTIDTDTGNIATSVASIDTKTPALGQALAAASVPVVLTAAQLSTLTPLATVAVTQSGTWDEVGINDSGNSITVDNGGTFVVQENGAALTALQLLDDTVYSGDAPNSKYLGIGAQYDDVSPASVTENNVRALRMSSRRELYNQIRDAAGNERGANVDSLNQLLVSHPQPVGIHGNVTISGASLGDGAITDGVSAAIKATVLDYANANPLAVRLTDTAGDYVGAGAGTQYTEDVAATADPIGTMGMLVRADVPYALTSADGDNVAFRGTNRGEQFVKHIDAIPVINSGSFTVSGTAIPHTMGQQIINRLAEILVSTDQLEGYLDGVEGLLGTIDADTGNISTKIDTLAGAVSGSEMQVDVLTMPVVAVTQSGTWDEVGINDSGNSITVDNGGTFVVQENGASLTALQIIDDWDESDRAKVNPIVGQAGVAAGAGAVDALTQRTTLASNDPAVASLALLDDIVLSSKRAGVANATDVVTHSGNVPLVVQRQPVNFSVNGGTLISGFANRKVRVLGGFLLSSAATTLQLKSGNNSDATGPLALIANEGFIIPYAETGNFETAVGQALTANISGSPTIGGWLSFVEV